LDYVRFRLELEEGDERRRRRSGRRRLGAPALWSRFARVVNATSDGNRN